MVKRKVLTPETFAVPGQLTGSVQWDTLALLVDITLNNYVEGEIVIVGFRQAVD